MSATKLFDSEQKLMELLWQHEPICAKQLSLLAEERIGWNKNTTYTIIKKLIEKKVILREDPNFVCTSLMNRQEARKSETRVLIDKWYDGSKKAFFASFLEDQKLNKEELAQLRDMIEKR